MIAIRALILCSFVLCALTPLNAERPELSGEISFEEEDKVEGGYAVSQNRAIEVFKNLLGQIDTLRTLGTANIESMDDSTIQYLTAVYLFCTINQGTCPVLLDGLFELDAIESKFRGVSQCPRLSRFWNLWLKNDMERRQEFLVKTGYLNVADEFKRNKRGRYIKCKDTLEKEIDFKRPSAAFFAARYGEGSQELHSLNQTVALLEKIKANVGNVFQAMDIQFASKDKDSEPDGHSAANKRNSAAKKGKSSTGSKPAKKKTLN